MAHDLAQTTPLTQLHGKMALLRRKYLDGLLIVFILSAATTIIVEAGKLSETVLRSSQDLVSASSGQPSENNSENAVSQWINEGFSVANVTQMSTHLGSAGKESKNVLLARKTASLSTSLKNFDHTFLSIKFYYIIGHAKSKRPVTTTTTTTTTTTAPPTTSVPSGSVIIGDQAIEIDELAPFLTHQKQPEESAKPLSPVSPEEPLTIASDNKKVIQLNPEPAEEQSVIELSLQHPVASPVEPTEPLTPGIDPQRIAPAAAVGQMQPTSLRRVRRLLVNDARLVQRRQKRDLSSTEEILRFKELKRTKRIDDILALKGMEESETRRVAPVPPLSRKTVTDPEKTTAGKGKNRKLPYETWRASMDKNNRPPGFYVMVDDKVIYDNWYGIWFNSKAMGRNVAPSKHNLWNETTLLMQYDGIPESNIQISFEWEPDDLTSFLFISNITVSTFGASSRTSDQPGNQVQSSDSTTGKDLVNNKPEENTKTAAPSSSASNNRTVADRNQNITVYIVVRQQDQEKAAVSNNHTVNIVQQVSNPGKSGGRYDVVSMTTRHNNGVPRKQWDATGLIVSCVTGILFFVIMIFMIQKKIQDVRRRGCNTCR